MSTFRDLLTAAHVENPEDFDKVREVWNMDILKRLKEQPFADASAPDQRHAYRFLWLRTFDRPVAIRVEITEDKVDCHIKICSGQAGYEVGRCVHNQVHQLTQKQISGFLKLIGKVQFWDLSEEWKYQAENGDEIIICDGAYWIVEGIHHGKYHRVKAHSPESGPVRELGLAFLDLGNVFDQVIY
jgi:hypothetical protein